MRTNEATLENVAASTPICVVSDVIQDISDPVFEKILQVFDCTADDIALKVGKSNTFPHKNITHVYAKRDSSIAGRLIETGNKMALESR